MAQAKTKRGARRARPITEAHARRAVLAWGKAHGITVTDAGDAIELDAPRGQCFEHDVHARIMPGGWRDAHEQCVTGKYEQYLSPCSDGFGCCAWDRDAGACEYWTDTPEHVTDAAAMPQPQRPPRAPRDFTPPPSTDTFVYDDGGRAASGRHGTAGDCVTRAIAIARALPYGDVYAALARGMQSQRRTKRSARNVGVRSARNGVQTRTAWFRRYMASLGFRWVPCMRIGSGCTVHLRAQELPSGNIIAAVSRHYVAVVDGVIRDTSDCSRGGTRCVYGYWTLTKF